MTIDDALRKECKIRFNVRGRKSLIVNFPYAVVEREARKHNLSVEEFLKKYQAVAQYDNFDGVFYAFEPVKEQ